VVKALALVPQDPAIVGGTGAPVIGVAWTLQYEVIFYAFFGLLILNSLLAVVLLSLVLLGWLLDWPMPLDFMKFHFFLLFAAGMVVGWLLRRELWSSFALPAATAGGVGFVGVCTLAALDSSLDVTTVDSGLGIPLLIGASASLTIFGLVTLERQGWNFASRSGGLLGDASYVLYLLHYPIISMVCKISLAAGLSGFSGALIAWVFGLSLCIATAIVFHSLIERRIISIGRQLLGRFNL
jgi:peptidoglycan/LPS O-acetylase OafA/YrhL